MRILFLVLFSPFLFSCINKKKADLLVYNAAIYTVDSAFSVAEAMVITKNKIEAVGNKKDLEGQYDCKEQLDAGGKFIYPGFIDAHAHFMGYAQTLAQCDLTGTKSWHEILERLKLFAKENPGGWIEGNGWDQNDWPVKAFPDNDSLNKLFPGRPVFLSRIDGHAAIVNDKALSLAGIKPGQAIDGGTYETRNNRLTGILIDNALNIVASKIPVLSGEHLTHALMQAQRNCFAAGLTTIDDCGLDFDAMEILQKLQLENKLRIRLYVLLSDHKKNYDYLEKKGTIKTDFLQVRGFKVYADGALGSRGACLLQDYTDKKGWKGFLLSKPAHFDSVASFIAKHNWQMCTHAIGDSGNRTILNLYARYLEEDNDRRWRIEHAQVVHPDDFLYFKKYHIIPSVQPTHATSDMYWAQDRLGSQRIKGAYAYQQLLQQNGWLPLGTDFPVEGIDPLKTFYAAVARRDIKGFPAEGFQMESALSREQALRGMTIWAAKANFEENEKGSLEPGKFADFVILDRDLMNIPEKEILSTLVLKTYVNGRKEYENH